METPNYDEVVDDAVRTWRGQPANIACVAALVLEFDGIRSELHRLVDSLQHANDIPDLATVADVRLAPLVVTDRRTGPVDRRVKQLWGGHIPARRTNPRYPNGGRRPGDRQRETDRGNAI